MKLYKRNILRELKGKLKEDRVLILQGAHRVGKTSVLLLLQEWLTSQGKKCVYYNLSYPDVLERISKGASDITSDLASRGQANKEIYLLIDDLQCLKNPRRFLESLSELDKKIHLIMATAIKIVKPKSIKRLEIMPLSFKEFLNFKGVVDSDQTNYAELFKEYVKYGGFPEVVLEPEIEKKKQFLWEVVDTHLRKDLTDIAKVKDVFKFYKLLRILSGQVGQTIDMTTLCREAGMSFPTLTKHLAFLEQSLMVEKITPYSHQPANEISRSPKFFFLDSGLQSILWLSQFSPTILEPIFQVSVFSELLGQVGRGSVRFWKNKTGSSVDFIVQKRNGPILAVDTVINFQRLNQKHIGAFKRRYKLGLWRVIGLEGEKLTRNGYYPWEI